MSQPLSPEICVIGAGPAGLTVAAAAAAFGVPVVLVEKDRMGGDCLNSGCVPSKALLAAGKRVQAIREAARLGIAAGDPEVDFAAVQRHVRGVIAAIQPNDSAERFGAMGVTVIRGAARFRDRRTVQVGSTEIRARRFVLATGSRPAVPAIANLDTVPYLTNETIFDVPRRPGHLIVLGGGSVGIELAQAFRRLGSDVTVLEAGKALSKDDPELAALLIENLKGEGIDIREGVEVTRAARRGRSGLRVTLGREGAGEHVDGTHLLVATGRRPDLDGLGLAEAGIAFDERGIKVDGRLRTTNRRVYAIGDATGGPQFTHWAAYQAGLVVRSILFRFGGRLRQGGLPWVTFTDPELAHVGLTEAEAFRKYRKIEVLRWPLSENDRAQAERATRGLVKVLVTRRGKIVGAAILGPNASELIAPWAIAISAGLRIRSFAAAVLPYPTYSEAGKRAAITFYAKRLNSRVVRWALRLARMLG